MKTSNRLICGMEYIISTYAHKQILCWFGFDPRSILRTFFNFRQISASTFFLKKYILRKKRVYRDNFNIKDHVFKKRFDFSITFFYMNHDQIHHNYITLPQLNYFPQACSTPSFLGMFKKTQLGLFVLSLDGTSNVRRASFPTWQH